MKMYAIANNQYLSEKQCGIQGMHATSELFAKYHVEPKSKAFAVYKEWATNHKTVILTKGGNCLSLKKTFTKLKKLADELNLPIAKFNEDKTLNNAFTCIGIIFPTEESFDFFNFNVDQMNAYDKLDDELSRLQLL
jgi:hypothetical protein